MIKQCFSENWNNIRRFFYFKIMGRGTKNDCPDARTGYLAQRREREQDALTDSRISDRSVFASSRSQAVSADANTFSSAAWMHCPTGQA